MALTVNTNTGSLNAQRIYSRHQQAVSQVLAQLASGSRINSAADDPAGLAMTDRMSAQIGGMQQALNNANYGISMAQTAEGATGGISNDIQRLRELAIQSANGTLPDYARNAIQEEANQLTQNISQTVNNTEFNGLKLLSGNQAQTFQVGPNGTSNDQITMTGANLDNTPANSGLNTYNADLNATKTIDLSTQANALNALSKLDQDLNTLSKVRTNFGAAENRFTTTISNLANAQLNALDARSRMSDTDFAAATAALTKNQVLSSANIATLLQANISQSAALTLLRK